MFRRMPPQRKHKMTQDLLKRPFEKKESEKSTPRIMLAATASCPTNWSITIGRDHVSLAACLSTPSPLGTSGHPGSNSGPQTWAVVNQGKSIQSSSVA